MKCIPYRSYLPSLSKLLLNISLHILQEYIFCCNVTIEIKLIFVRLYDFDWFIIWPCKQILIDLIRYSRIFWSMQLNLLQLFLIHLHRLRSQFHWWSRTNSVWDSTLFGENKVRKYLGGASKQVGTANQHYVLVKCLVIRALQWNVRGETHNCPW